MQLNAAFINRKQKRFHSLCVKLIDKIIGACRIEDDSLSLTNTPDPPCETRLHSRSVISPDETFENVQLLGKSPAPQRSSGPIPRSERVNADKKAPNQTEQPLLGSLGPLGIGATEGKPPPPTHKDHRAAAAAQPNNPIEIHHTEYIHSTETSEVCCLVF